MLITIEVIVGLVLLGILVFFRVPLILGSMALLAFVLGLTTWHGLTWSLSWVWLFLLTATLVLNLPILRRRIVTAKFFLHIKNTLPLISTTEQAVLDAGDVWWEKALFTGQPNWSKFLKFPAAVLSAREQDFIDNQVNVLCAMLIDWDIIKQGDLPPQAWDYIKRERFLGLVIPSEYGGHGFSAYAHSTIIMKIASRSYSAAVHIMVPNAVGLAEFILHYGTQEQKKYHLPRFALGEEIPCFALTAAEAGSDAGSMLDEGKVTYGQWQGKETLGLCLNWDKRYITLAPVASMIGVAFKLYDPEHLIGTRVEVGITLAMVPRNTPGVEVGKRHSPLMMGFLNGPVRGCDVFIPLDYIIGGSEACGKGWAMMMECLAVGRGLSVPALSVGTAKLTYRMTSAYVKIREQFHTSIGYFEGMKEPLAQIGAFTYLCEATRCLTASAINHGIRPSVAATITKYHLTEMTRKIVNNAMDMHGGKAIQLGPRNYLGLYYIAQPISITVEGANILTRNLIIFGQGMLRCHPYLQQEVAALQDPHHQRGLKKFDRLFFKHIGYVLANVLRCLGYGITHAKWITAPVQDSTAKYYRQLTRMSVALAVVTDIAIGVMGEELKQSERLSARLGDVLSYLYLASAALKYYNDNQKHADDLLFVVWIQEYCLYQIANAFDHFFVNFPFPKTARWVRRLIFPWGRNYYLPLDKQDHQIADIMMQNNALRERLTQDIYLGEKQDICQKTEQVFLYQLSLQAIYEKLQAAIKIGIIKEKDFEQQILAAKNATILTDQEVNQLMELNHLRRDVIQVDAFNFLARNEKHDDAEAVIS